MSDEPDPSALPRWEELLRRLEQTHRRLETAHTEYVEACAESQRALCRVVEAFGDLSETIQALVPPSAATEGGDAEAAADAIADGHTSESEPDAPTPEDEEIASPQTGADSDHGQNTLPAHLHSRGVSIPRPADPPRIFETGPSGTDGAATSPTEPAAQTDVLIDYPTLVDTPQEDATAFSGLNKESRILLTNDGFGVAAALENILSDQGYRVRVGSRRPDFSSPVDTLIFLGSLRAPRDLDDAMSVVDDAMYTAQKMTTRLMQPDSAFVAVIDTAGGFGLDAFDPVVAPYGALLGLVRLIDRRHPGAATRLIDIDASSLASDRLAQRVATELMEGGDDSPIALGHNSRRTISWEPYQARSRPAPWLIEEKHPPIVYMPGPDAVLTTAVERLAIAHELPVALLRRRHAPSHLNRKFHELGIDVVGAKYDLNRLFSAMDFLDAVRGEYGPIAAVVAESVPAKNPDDLARWEIIRPPVDEFNALLAMTINDPLRMLGVGIGPRTPPIVASSLRYFARAESLRRNDHLRVRLAHLERSAPRRGAEFNPRDFALTEFLSAADPLVAEARFADRGD